MKNSLFIGFVPVCFKSSLVTSLLNKPTLVQKDVKKCRPDPLTIFVKKILPKIVFFLTLPLPSELQISSMSYPMMTS